MNPDYHHYNSRLTAALNRPRNLKYMTAVSFVVMLAIMTFCGIAVTIDTEPPVAKHEAIQKDAREWRMFGFEDTGKRR